MEYAQEYRQFYFGVEPPKNLSEIFKRLNNLFSDFGFIYGVDRYAKIHANKSIGNTFFYR